MPFVNPKLHGTLRVIVECAFGYTIGDDPGLWTWTDITKYVIGQVSMAAGAEDQGASATPARVSMMLANTDGRFTALNPASPYWPNVVLNTPLRVSMTWDNASSTYELLTVFVDGWPLQPNAGVINVTVPLSASGRLRRMRNASGPTRSAMVGSLSGYAPVRSYWPLENGSLTSPITGVKPASMQFGTWQGVTGFDGSDSLPVFGVTAGFGADIAGTFTDVGWMVDWYMNFPSSYAGTTNIFQVNMPTTSGFSYATVSLATTVVNVQWWDFFGAVLRSLSFSIDSTFFGTWQHFRLSMNVPVPVGNTDAVISATRLSDGTVLSNSRSDAIGGLVAPTSLTIVRSPNLNGTQFGQVVVFDGIGSTAMDNANTGWTGESATVRAQRICDENTVPITVGAIPASPPPQMMGPQQITTVAAILADVADVDNGLLHDGGTSGNLVYNSGVLRYNAAVAFTLDYYRHQIGDGMTATYDDQSLVQQWTATGADASATWLSPTVTDPHPDIYAKSGSINVATPAQLMTEAQWRVNLGMFNGYRIPSISVDVRGRNPELAQAMTALVLPSRISPANVPSPYPPQSFDQFIEGWSAVVDAVTWQVNFNCSPYSPWRAWVLGDTVLGRLDAVNSYTPIPVTNGATSLQVVTTPGPLWTTAGGDVPVDINFGGEQCTVTNISSPSLGALTRVGARIDAGSYSGVGTHYNDAIPRWNSITGIGLSVLRWYNSQGDFNIGTDLTQMLAANAKVCLTLRPDYSPLNPAHLVALEAMLSTMKNASATLNITLWHEPYFSGLTAAQFVAMVRYYGPTVRKYFPLWVCFSGPDVVTANGFYPGDAYCDGIAIDHYVASSFTNFTDCEALADTAHKPFAVWEFNGGADLGSPTPPVGQTQAAVTARFQLIQQHMTDRLAAGKLNGDLIFFSSPGGSNGSRNWLGDALSDDGGFETTLGRWTQAGGCTIARSTLHAKSGNASMAFTATGVGNMDASMITVNAGNLASFGLPCVAGQTVMGSAWFFAPTTSRTCVAVLRFYDAAATQISSVAAGGVADNASSFTYAQNSTTVPVGAVFAVLWLQINGPVVAGEVHYVDDPQIAVLPATNDLTSSIQYPWDYRIALLIAMQTALDGTSFPQQMTVVRSRNGVVKAHSAGTAISLWQSGGLAL